MAVTLKAVQQYINGKKYARFMKNPTVDASTLEQFLKPVVTPGSGKKSKKKGKGEKKPGGKGGGDNGELGKNADNHKQLYCELTQRLINRDPTHVAKHVQGYRFLREKQKYDDCVRQGIPYTGIVRSKQKNMKKHPDDDDDEEDDEDEALEKDKKFSTNPEISDSEEENEEEKQDDLEDLYPPEDFESQEDGEEEGEGGDDAKGKQADSTDEEEDEDEDDLFPDSTSSEEESDQQQQQQQNSKPGFKGVPFKMQSPAKRKLSNGASFKKRKFKKKSAA